MDQDSIFAVIKKNLLLILPDLSSAPISIDDSLRELGANSIDRMEIIVQTMADLKVKIPLIEFGKAKNMLEITAIFSNHLQQSLKEPS